MFDVELILRILAVVVGVIILSSSFIDFNYLIAKLLLNKNKVVNATTTSDEFLQIIDLWYKLRGKCVTAKLDSAIHKLDEVFPLLNENVEKSNV